MTMRSLYSTALWRRARARALSRDGRRCTVARLLGGPCSAELHVHHLVPVEDGGALYDLENLITACSRHHPKLEALRRAILSDDDDGPPRCPHQHRHPEARRQCEERLAREYRQHRRSSPVAV